MNFFKSLLLSELFTGLSLTLKHLFMRKVTVLYPEEKTKKEEYPIVMSASIPSSSSSVLGKVESPEVQIPEASPELIAAVVKAKPKKKAVKKEISIGKEGSVKKVKKPKDKGNDMLLS